MRSQCPDLVCAYRALHPTRRCNTFLVRGVSRIDRIYVSSALMPHVEQHLLPSQGHDALPVGRLPSTPGAANTLWAMMCARTLWASHRIASYAPPLLPGPPRCPSSKSLLASSCGLSHSENTVLRWAYLVKYTQVRRMPGPTEGGAAKRRWRMTGRWSEIMPVCTLHRGRRWGGKGRWGRRGVEGRLAWGD